MGSPHPALLHLLGQLSPSPPAARDLLTQAGSHMCARVCSTSQISVPSVLQAVKFFPMTMRMDDPDALQIRRPYVVGEH